MRNDIEQQILTLIESSIEDTRVPDAIAAHAPICRAARAIVKLREAREELAKLVDYGQPLNVVRYPVEKLAGKE